MEDAGSGAPSKPPAPGFHLGVPGLVARHIIIFGAIHLFLRPMSKTGAKFAYAALAAFTGVGLVDLALDFVLPIRPDGGYGENYR